MLRRVLFGVIGVGSIVAIAACSGGGNPADPGNGAGGSGSGSAGNCSVPVGVLGCPKGLVRGTLDGQTFNGGVANGGAIYTPIAPVLNLPAQDFFVFNAIASNNSQLTVTARAKVGQAALGANIIDPETHNVSVNAAILAFPATGGATIGAGWLTSVAGGSGTITVDSVSRTGASGSFLFSMVPTPGTTATGTRAMSGTFNVTF